MRIITIAVAVIALMGVLGTTFFNSQSKQQASQQVAAKPAFAKLIDVRTPEEYAISRAESSTLFPLQNIERGELPTEDKNEAIALYCRSGNRSSQAKKILEEQGFKNVTDLGGLSDLKSHGISLVK
jgi:phage shock protein E